MGVALALLVGPSTSMAQAPLPVGEAHGVRVVREKGAIVVVFTRRAAKLYRRIAGRLVDVDCTDQQPGQPVPPRAHAFLVPHHPGEITEESSGGVRMRAPRHRRRLVTGDLTRGMDYCRVWLAPRIVRRDGARQRIQRRLIVSVPLKISGWPSYAQLIDQFPSGARAGLASLAGPADTPPAGTIGYYSDRLDHVAVATLSRSNRRLFIELEADALHTNVAGYIFNER